MMPTSLKTMSAQGHSVYMALLACGQVVKYKDNTSTLRKLFEE